MITNSTGKIAKLIKSLMNKKSRDDLKLFIVEGSKFIREIPKDVYIEFYACSNTFYEKNLGFAFRENVMIHIFSEKAFLGISDTVTPQGIIAVCRKIVNDEDKIFSLCGNGIYIVLDAIKNPGNLGTIIRTADASGAKAILLSENTVDVYNPKVLRSTMGSVFNIPFVQGLSIGRIIEQLKKHGVTVIGTSLDATRPYYEEDLKKNVAVIIGSEDSGMSEAATGCCDELVTIPIDGNAESLNAAVAASIIMYESLRQRKVECTDDFNKTKI